MCSVAPLVRVTWCFDCSPHGSAGSTGHAEAVVGFTCPKPGGRRCWVATAGDCTYQCGAQSLVCKLCNMQLTTCLLASMARASRRSFDRSMYVRFDTHPYHNQIPPRWVKQKQQPFYQPFEFERNSKHVPTVADWWRRFLILKTGTTSSNMVAW